MKVHKQVHIQKKLTCITCDKIFQTDHSFKQHMLAKHKDKDSSPVPKNNTLPVGHPDRYQKKQEVRKSIACMICSKLYATGKEVEEHMEEHTQENEQNEELEYTKEDKICRYFRNGFCFKGEKCIFKHIKNKIPVCKRGPECSFLYQN